MSSTALIRSMLALRNERRSGVLTIDSERARTFVYLRDGIPIFAEEGTNGETLGRLLVRQRLLTQEQYAHIIQKMTEALVINEQLRFGELAVELGYLTDAQVHKALVDQVRWKIVRAFQRSDVRWSFEDSVARLDDVGSFPMLIEALVLDAVRWIDDEQKMEMGLGAVLDQTIRVDPGEVASIAARFALTEEEAALVRVLDGRTARAAFETRQATEVDAHAIVTALVVTRAVATSTEPRLARPVTPIVEIPVQAARAPAPAARPQIRRASRILQALEAQRVKVEPERKPGSDHEAKLLAERALQAALPHLRAGRYAQAAPDLARAAQLQPTSDEYKLYARWCSVRAAGSPALHPTERVELRRIAMAATKADPNFGFGFYVAGACALDEGDMENAARLLARAVRLDPTIADANRLHRIATRDSQEGPKGLFSRDLFGKKS